ncbi:MAG: cytochrome c oxidase subunit II [Alphaproteobacteria bacterium]|nr:cytochrome c oxidase subunit II [Alphaproteobacteria bacterium]
MGFDRVSGFRALRIAALAALLVALAAPLGYADSTHVVEPHNWQLGFQEASTPVKERIEWLHNILLVVITCISAFVMVLLVYVMLRFNSRSNPVPSRTAHNTWIEVAWTVVPILILFSIAIPSMKLMFYMDKTQDAQMTIKVTGHQWYWSYEYPDYDNVGFDSNLIPEDQLKEGQKRLLDVDNRLVVPVGTNVRVLIIGVDVMHSWFMPSFGVQMYATPGRTNESWFNVEREGVYYGQCNQICGVNHAFMPIVVEAMAKPDFDKWIAAKKAAAHNDKAPAATPTAAAPTTEAPKAAAAETAGAVRLAAAAAQ